MWRGRHTYASPSSTDSAPGNCVEKPLAHRLFLPALISVLGFPRPRLGLGAQGSEHAGRRRQRAAREIGGPEVSASRAPQAPPRHRQRFTRLGSNPTPWGRGERRRVRVTSPAGVGQGRPSRQRCPRLRVGNGGVLGLHLRHRERQVSKTYPPGFRDGEAGELGRGPERWRAARAGGGGARRSFRPREPRAAASWTLGRAGRLWERGLAAAFRPGGAAFPARRPSAARRAGAAFGRRLELP